MFEKHLKNGNESINHTSANIYIYKFVKTANQKIVFFKKSTEQ